MQNEKQNFTVATNNCPAYGCPQFPVELTPQLNQTLTDAFQSNQHDQLLHDFATDAMAMLTQQGKSHSVNQDRGLFIAPFVIHAKLSPAAMTVQTESFLAAIFDGHGRLGHLVAQEVVERFPQVLVETLRRNLYDEDSYNEWWKDDSNDALVAAALNESFLQVNREGTEFNFLRGGTTASVTLRFGQKLYVANAGDSQTVLVSINPLTKNNPTVVFMTRKDKPFEEDEMTRIQSMGGKIHINPLHPQDTRVVVHSKAAKDTIALAMSRSIGDWEWKAVGVTAEPIVTVIDLRVSPYKDSALFLITASDGLWDVRKKGFFAEQFATVFHNDVAKETAKSASGVSPPPNKMLRPIFKLHDIFQRITPKVKRGYCDDITAVITKVK